MAVTNKSTLSSDEIRSVEMSSDDMSNMNISLVIKNIFCPSLLDTVVWWKNLSAIKQPAVFLTQD